MKQGRMKHGWIEIGEPRKLTSCRNRILTLDGVTISLSAKFVSAISSDGDFMVGLATAIFIGLFAFGNEFLGWGQTNNSQVQLGLFLAFVLGIVCGYKTKG